LSLGPGTRLGPYEVIAQIGAGGMGEVYRARDTKLNRDVALKVLPDALAADNDRLARFKREAQVLASLNHSHIAAIYGFEDSGSTHALVLELVEGPTLADRITKGAIPIDEALLIAGQIADALEAAHERGVIHRDLKPANIKLTPDDKVKVLDFGLAKMLETSPAPTALSMSPTLSVHATYAGVILGTAVYMSPEQARGKAVDKRTDIWSFGCVLYEMLTGKPPFQGDDIAEVIGAIIHKDVPWDRLPSNMPGTVPMVLTRCLEKDPKQRIHDVADVRLALEGAFESSPSPNVLATTTAGSMPPTWTRIVTSVAMLLIGAIITAGGAWKLRPSVSAPMLRRFSVPLGEGQAFSNTGRQVVALSPDGSSLVYVANTRLYLRSMSNLEVRVIPGSEGGGTGLDTVAEPVFSPDGQWLAFWSSADKSLKRLPVSGGAAVTICTADAPWGMSWGESGIVFGEAANGILRVAPAGGKPELIASVGPDEVASSPRMLPSGKAVLFSVKKFRDVWDTGQVVVQPLGGARKVVVEGGADGRYVPTGHLVYAVSGVLFAAPFDLDRLRVTAGPVGIIEGIARSSGGTGGPATAQYSFATDGSLAYVPGPARTGNFDRSLALFDGKGGFERLKLPPGTYSSPRLSPDGKAVTFDQNDETNENVWVWDLAGTTAARRLTFGGRNRAPIWSPDGLWIAFQSDRDGDFAIFRQRADGSGSAERLTKPESRVSHLPQAWSPDGAYLLFTVERDRQFSLATFRMTDRQSAEFGGVRSAIPTDAAFSPDGRWVAYQFRDMHDDANNHVYVQPFPATGAKYLVPQNGAQPYWSRRGDLLHLNVAANRSVVVPVVTTPHVEFGQTVEFSRFRRTEPNPATGRRNADAMPDGRIIGVLVGSDGSFNQITVVLNWFEELKQRVPLK
jgi:serine/threonine-protein kinase